VPATTAGNLYPIYLMHEAGLVGQTDAPRMRWVGTHDDVIYEVMQGNVDAGACKNLRLDAWESEHGQGLIRRLATGDAVPNNALIMRGDVKVERIEALQSALLGMHETEAGRLALAKFGAMRFEPCGIDQFEAIYRMTQAIEPAWSELGIDGPAPKQTDSAPDTPGGD
jgi:ABC-type phosphate/phosphonate transport system substrate-binding protein